MTGVLNGTPLGGFVYDGNGSPTTYRGTNIGYDTDQNAILFGSSASPQMTAGYNSGGLRVWKQGPGGRTYFLYDCAAPIVELSSTGATIAVKTFGPDGRISRKVNGSPVCRMADFFNRYRSSIGYTIYRLRYGTQTFCSFRISQG